MITLKVVLQIENPPVTSPSLPPVMHPCCQASAQADRQHSSHGSHQARWVCQGRNQVLPKHCCEAFETQVAGNRICHTRQQRPPPHRHVIAAVLTASTRNAWVQRHHQPGLLGSGPPARQLILRHYTQPSSARPSMMTTAQQKL